jgi:hypothetical protein
VDYDVTAEIKEDNTMEIQTERGTDNDMISEDKEEDNTTMIKMSFLLQKHPTWCNIFGASE